ncbi:hypothetical protein I6N95_15560 [Vagococcus sp. BWB3-3]|uniref:Uncharacterized protein n=1 Tax=Vagococcus allomyrinae TaxID=2794353 RepID=A0A940SVK8_9ENTE|nr:hypothetical protein [Vagococcus allomyrinae]MBP1042435.1 hypothetical protein [Vagococcus allomyrinae]
MYRGNFQSQKVELSLKQGGKTSKQTLANVRETASSESLVALGRLFEELAPTDAVLAEVVTIARVSHVLG